MHAQSSLEKQDLFCTCLAPYEPESINEITVTVIVVLALHGVQSVGLRL